MQPQISQLRSVISDGQLVHRQRTSLPQHCSKSATSSHLQPLQIEPHLCLWDGCGQNFEDLDGLVEHIVIGHIGKCKHFICMWQSCPRQQMPFTARYKLVVHMRIHSGEKPYKCMVSETVYSAVYMHRISAADRGGQQGQFAPGPQRKGAPKQCWQFQIAKYDERV